MIRQRFAVFALRFTWKYILTPFTCDSFLNLILIWKSCAIPKFARRIRERMMISKRKVYLLRTWNCLRFVPKITNTSRRTHRISLNHRINKIIRFHLSMSPIDMRSLSKDEGNVDEDRYSSTACILPCFCSCLEKQDTNTDKGSFKPLTPLDIIFESLKKLC